MSSAPRLRLQLDSPVPAYRQIVDELRILLVEGRLRTGDVLPSVRQLALDLGVHFNTVGEAYRQLAAEGWLDLRHGRRAIVVDRSVPAAAPENLHEFRNRLRALVAEARAKGMSVAKITGELSSASGALDR